MRKAKIVCTPGPSSRSEATVEQPMAAGDPLVVLSGVLIGAQPPTNLLKLHRAGEG